MAKERTNYIQDELERVEDYVVRIQLYLDENPINHAKDRFGPPGKGGFRPVVSKKEDQAKAYMNMLKDLPKLLKDLNELRKAIAGEEKKEIRGDAEIPDFMNDDNENKQPEEDEEFYKATKKPFDNLSQNDSSILSLNNDLDEEDENEDDYLDDEDDW